MEIKLNNNVCREYWVNSCVSGNLGPGIVINAFSIFSSALVNARRWKENGDEKAKKTALTIMNTAFPGKARKGAYTPLPRGLEEDGNVHHYIISDVVKAKFEEMAQMELTPDNIILACIDLQAAARMYAEQTIDAAKTGLTVVVENIKELRRLQAASKLEAEIAFDWDKQKATFKKGKLPAGSKKKLVQDIFEEFRMDGFDIALKLGEYFARLNQTMPEEILREGAELAGKASNRKAVGLLRKVKENYATLNQIQRFTVRQQTEGVTDEQFISEVKRAIKPAFDTQFAALSNMLRSEMADMPAKDRALLAIHVTFEQAKNENVSRFAQDLLAQEMVQLILFKSEGDESVPQYTEDALIRCHGYEEGEVVDFVFGEASDNNKLAIAKDATLEGEFVIRKNRNGKFVASKKIADMIVAPEGKKDEIVFVTKMNVGFNKETVAALEKVLVKGADVQLVPVNKKHDLHDAVLINGVEVAKFQCNSKKDAKDIQAYFNSLFAVKGKLKSAVYGMTEKDGQRNLQAVITIVDCEKTTKVEAYNGKQIVEETIRAERMAARAAKKAEREAKQAKALVKGSFANCEDALPGIAMPVKKVAKTAPKKADALPGLPGFGKVAAPKKTVAKPAVKKTVVKAAPKKGRVKSAAGGSDAILI